MTKTNSLTVSAPSVAQRNLRVRRYPLTSVLAALYVPLVLWPAILDGNPQRTFVYKITLSCLLITFLVETVMISVRGRRGHRRFININRAGMISVTGALAQLAGSQLGLGVYGFGNSYGNNQASHLVVFLTPLLAWPYLGVILCIYAWRSQPSDRKRILRYTTITVLLTFATALIAAGTGALFQILFVFAACGFVSGAFRGRWLVVGIAVVFLAWPYLYSVRNSERAALVPGAFSGSTESAGVRLEFDRYMATANMLKSDNLTIPAPPSFWLILEAGLIPRFIDPNRPVIQTATRINQAYTGSTSSAATLTTLGETWFLYGWSAMVAISAGLAVMVGILTRNRSPFALCLVGGVMVNLVWPEQAYPDAIAGFMQFVVSSIVALIIFRPVIRHVEADALDSEH